MEFLWILWTLIFYWKFYLRSNIHIFDFDFNSDLIFFGNLIGNFGLYGFLMDSYGSLMDFLWIFGFLIVFPLEF